ncbi:MAG: hypothetical protein ACR2HA_08655 [Nocardioides sp.]
MASTPAQGPVGTTTSRRRQRSVRVSVAVGLLSVATLVVLGAVTSRSPAWLTAASLLALACGWAAARIVYTELVQSRRDNATDRAAQAQAYRSVFAERSLEHAEFTSAMVDRVVTRDRKIAELTSLTLDAELLVAEAETRVQSECRRANEADTRADEADTRADEADTRADDADTRADEADTLVAELRGRIEELEIRRAEQFDQLASWEGFETVVDMMAWEQKIAAAHRAGAAEETKQA